ncbi:hypothetical protein SDC9_103080 [bioreactor metagenome]|uniref:Uncharacterized protein n=1 Tax=bioreactor metagenome TaxID=1076179 RepID=A0A645AU40_9ZZZZ
MNTFLLSEPDMLAASSIDGSICFKAATPDRVPIGMLRITRAAISMNEVPVRIMGGVLYVRTYPNPRTVPGRAIAIRIDHSNPLLPGNSFLTNKYAATIESMDDIGVAISARMVVSPIYLLPIVKTYFIHRVVKLKSTPQSFTKAPYGTIMYIITTNTEMLMQTIYTGMMTVLFLIRILCLEAFPVTVTYDFFPMTLFCR